MTFPLSKAKAGLIGLLIWFIAPVFIFGGSGAHDLVTLWLVLIAAYFLLNPVLLLPAGTVATWKAKTGIKLFALLAAALVFAFILACYAWELGLNAKLFAGPDDLMFYVIVLFFQPMAMLVMVGLISRIFVERDDAIGEFLFCGVAGALVYWIQLTFPTWRFSNGIVQFATEAGVAAFAAGLISWVAYKIFK